MGISQSQGRYLHTEQHKRRINAHIHALSGIETHGPSIRASRAATVIGVTEFLSCEIQMRK
jgi:hypothetical protein